MRFGFGSSTVGMPVTRHPPCRPGRAVCPHPVPRLDALPRCKAASSRGHPTASDCRNARPCSPSPVKHRGERLPRTTLPLAASPGTPCACTIHGPVVEAGQRASGPSDPVVMGGSPESCGQTWAQLASWQLPVLRDPCLAPLPGRRELLARRAPLDARDTLPLWQPEPGASQARAAPLQAGGTTAEA